MIWLVVAILVLLAVVAWSAGSLAHDFKVAQRPSEGRERPTIKEEHDAIISVMTGVDDGDPPDEFKCASCGLWWQDPSSFATVIDLEMPFLDHKLPIQVEICKECLA